ncbi:hypothetical protein CC1G_10343 [Coprinopsis cinerea okayama7|uniref:Uncharacterized protein n=1 Tax=Coprinopsis cinerea (strain Okayama-7 / 130 / ATCC MYA-4618 / FGSC 9003) TaxID=240176 RepID=A8P0L7_COPC7|nr:hypothetical protein CC1G_10343 [Coprinopsis cinerea okayama7\|eukprot:XP_001837922.2 hypothetical protein CC1G_10343 [Coprinopsis cinerea okayama7\
MQPHHMHQITPKSHVEIKVETLASQIHLPTEPETKRPRNYLAPAMPVPPLNEEESLFMVTNAQYAVRLENRLLETPGAEPVARIVSIGHMIALIIAQLMGIVNTLHQFVFGIHEHLVHRPEITDLVLELRNRRWDMFPHLETDGHSWGTQGRAHHYLGETTKE